MVYINVTDKLVGFLEDVIGKLIPVIFLSLIYFRNKISFQLHWDTNMQLVTWLNPIKPEGQYSRFDHVLTACSYHNATQKRIFYFVYLYFYLFMILLGFHNFWKADLNNDFSTRNIVPRYSSHYYFQQINNEKVTERTGSCV